MAKWLSRSSARHGLMLSLWTSRCPALMGSKRPAGKREWPDTKVLVLTHLTDDDTRREAFEKGADAFLDKRDMVLALVPAI